MLQLVLGALAGASLFAVACALWWHFSEKSHFRRTVAYHVAAAERDIERAAAAEAERKKRAAETQAADVSKYRNVIDQSRRSDPGRPD